MTKLCVWDLDGTIRPGCLMTDAVRHCAEMGWTDLVIAEPAYPNPEEVSSFVRTITGKSLSDFHHLTARLQPEALQQCYPWALEQLQEQAAAGIHRPAVHGWTQGYRTSRRRHVFS